jgi:predicted helicase
MSQLLIQQYLNELATLRKVSGSQRESVIREAFKDLLKRWGRSQDLVFIPEYEIATLTKERRYVDGAMLYTLRMPFGYWEAKDEKDDLDAEIELKLRRGYPQDNIIFEDSRQAVLIQNRREVMRCPVDVVEDLARLLGLFFGYERAEIAQFRKAVDQFKADLPAVLAALRAMIESSFKSNADFRAEAERFLTHAQETINPNVTAADVREMLIQHVLTEEIFSKVFGEDDFHRQDNVAQKLYALEATFFTGDLKKRTLRGLDPYYQAIRGAASQISSHQEKQNFLKVIYENFYKVYNKKAADRLGVVYTPNEIVRFMIDSADWLCEKHFGKNLIDRDVEILDPATGTGTFVSELLEHFRGQPTKLKHKYVDELHANEVAILPYYVANLNIEATYAAITGEYLEFPNLCFVDTLDNVAGLRKYAGHTDDIFGSVSEENVARIKRQNQRKISVIIGNPPYNANQLNENENNKNREYPEIDKRIRETYVAHSDSHKTKTYDMYVRFVRWASDRIDANGVVAFVTNRSFIDKRAFDGFRKILLREFNHIYVVDLGGDLRDENVSAKGNIFGIKVGVAISFLVKQAGRAKHSVHLLSATAGSADEKLSFLGTSSAANVSFKDLTPDVSGDWNPIEREEFSTFLPLLIPKLSGKDYSPDRQSLFSLASFGFVSARDDWVTDFNRERLREKIQYYIATYNETVSRLPQKLTADWESKLDYSIKWSQDLRRRAAQREVLGFEEEQIVKATYRPFTKVFYYYGHELNWSLYRMPIFFPTGAESNVCIYFSDRGARAPFSVLNTAS